MTKNQEKVKAAIEKIEMGMKISAPMKIGFTSCTFRANSITILSETQFLSGFKSQTLHS